MWSSHCERQIVPRHSGKQFSKSPFRSEEEESFGTFESDQFNCCGSKKTKAENCSAPFGWGELVRNEELSTRASGTRLVAFAELQFTKRCLVNMFADAALPLWLKVSWWVRLKFKEWIDRLMVAKSQKPFECYQNGQINWSNLIGCWPPYGHQTVAGLYWSVSLPGLGIHHHSHSNLAICSDSKRRSRYRCVVPLSHDAHYRTLNIMPFGRFRRLLSGLAHRR